MVFVCNFSQAQKVELGSSQKIYLETGIKSIFLKFTDMNGGGKEDPYLQWSNQVRVGVPFNIFYRNKYFQAGVTTTFFAFGTETFAYNIDRFFAPNDINAHFGYNTFSLGQDPKTFFGPFAEFGIFNMGRGNGSLRAACNFGLETYIKNSTRVSIGCGLFDSKIKTERKLDNSFISFEISHSFPFRDPLQKGIQKKVAP